MSLQEWLEEIYEEHADALFRFLMHITGDSSETKDLLQELFIRLAKSPNALNGVSAPRSYLFRMAHHLVTDRYRRSDSRQRTEDQFQREQSQSFAPDCHNQDSAWIHKTLILSLESLPMEQRTVLALKIWEEMTFAQISEALQIPANTVASRYRYGLDKLRELLRPHYGDLK